MILLINYIPLQLHVKTDTVLHFNHVVKTIQVSFTLTNKEQYHVVKELLQPKIVY